MLHKLFQKTQKERNTTNLFYEARFTLLPKPGKDVSKKKKKKERKL
jgi:hypothetical protein